MKLVLTSLTLFFSMKLVYNHFGDYTNEYWNIVYYIPLYFMLISLLRYMWMMCRSKTQSLFFIMGMTYFSVLLILHLVCLFKIELYGRLISEVSTWGSDMFVLIGFVILINYLRVKSHASKN